jgi:hypothetical protein
MNRNVILFALLGVVACCRAAVSAIPGAEGFGALASGGHGGVVHHVPTQADFGAGSFRYGVGQPNCQKLPGTALQKNQKSTNLQRP